MSEKVKYRNGKLSIPVELIEYSLKNKCPKSLAIYIFLKFYTDGKVKDGSGVFPLLRETLNIRDNRTFSKHLKELIRLNWVGFDQTYGTYFIRSFNKVRAQLNLYSRTSVVCYPHNLKKIIDFFHAALIAKNIRAQKIYRYAKERGGRKRLAATINRDVAKQPVSSSAFPPQKYLGLANSVLAKIFSCSQTRACQIKRKASRQGFIQLKKHYEVLRVLEKKDPNARAMIYETDKKYVGRIVFRKRRGKIEMVNRLYDEIIPQVQIKKQTKFGRIKNAV